MRPNRPMPALLTSTSTPPNSATACAKRASTAASSRTSHTAPAARPASNSFNSTTVRSTSPASRALTHTFSPSRTSASAIARPMPLVLPVTTAVLSLRFIARLFPLQLFLQHFIHQLRVRLAGGSLHHLPDEEAHQAGLAGV